MDTEHDPRWARIVARDQEADGAFWYSVASTGVYCRPSCPARTAHPRHVRLHATLEEARASGGRPCARCNPEGESLYERNRELVRCACALIRASEHELPLDALAATVHRSASHLHRLFKEATGMTPKAYYRSCRAGRLRAPGPRAPAGTWVTFHADGAADAPAPMARMQPGRYRGSGVDETLRTGTGQCTLGTILVASGVRGLAALLLGDDPARLLDDLQERFPRARLVRAAGGHDLLLRRAIGLVDHPGADCDLVLDIRGNAFQQRVWQLLRATRPGATVTYAAIAAALGSPRRARAVAAACAANPLAVAIPCHRVARADGSDWGYAWGLARKEALRGREAARASLP